MDLAVQVAIIAGLEALKMSGIVSGIGNYIRIICNMMRIIGICIIVRIYILYIICIYIKHTLICIHHIHIYTYTGVGAEPWLLPEHFRDTTGVVFATSFPALDTAIAEVSKFYETKALYNQHIPIIIDILRSKLTSKSPNGILSKDVEDAIDALVHTLQSPLEVGIGYNEPNTVKPYEFDRKFLFRVLVLGNAQLAQIIKARGPNMQTNAACAGMYIIIYYTILYSV